MVVRYHLAEVDPAGCFSCDNDFKRLAVSSSFTCYVIGRRNLKDQVRRSPIGGIALLEPSVGSH